SATELVVRRRMSAAQQVRRDRILAVARELAAGGGYDAVVMRDVAERSGVALGTLYRYFASKDHLLAEVLVAWGGQLEQGLRRSPAKGEVRARITDMLQRAARTVEREPVLAAAVTQALLSRDPAVTDVQASFTTMMRRWLDIAIGDDDLPDRDRVVEVFEHVFFSTMIGLVNGRRDPAEIGEQLDHAAALLLDERA
ncbi:MAG TPA: TetR family transcriptional regulator, partial [Acidimicrobiia bacterium]|nr:TetR family transcriptional regulator [Acidimicrobiia bacterium]